MSAASQPLVIETIVEMRAVVAAERSAGRSVALTPTLGALHDGHIAHIRRAAELVDTRVVSIFVNPTQFTQAEDLERYPRTLEADRERLAAESVEFIFAPSVAEMYPTGPTLTTLNAGVVGSSFEGRSRPGHFDGVLTVVAKLLGIVSPDLVTFGQKDAQQLFLVTRMIADLNIATRVEVIETVRDSDGLALSSRNRFLSPPERRSARALSLALEAAASAAERGSVAASAAAQGALAGDERIELDYFALVHPATFQPVADDYRGAAISLIAARLGGTRLIDTGFVHIG